MSTGSIYLVVVQTEVQQDERRGSGICFFVIQAEGYVFSLTYI